MTKKKPKPAAKAPPGRSPVHTDGARKFNVRGTPDEIAEWREVAKRAGFVNVAGEGEIGPLARQLLRAAAAAHRGASS